MVVIPQNDYNIQICIDILHFISKLAAKYGNMGGVWLITTPRLCVKKRSSCLCLFIQEQEQTNSYTRKDKCRTDCQLVMRTNTICHALLLRVNVADLSLVVLTAGCIGYS